MTRESLFDISHFAVSTDPKMDSANPQTVRIKNMGHDSKSADGRVPSQQTNRPMAQFHHRCIMIGFARQLKHLHQRRSFFVGYCTH